LENHPQAREYFAQRTWGRIYIPAHSRSYIAFEGVDGPPSLAWLHSGFIEYREDDGSIGVVPLPTTRVGGMRGGGRSRPRDDDVLEVCTVCNYVIPDAGQCVNCAD